jgi:pimeloyl-ACP methyl ester carboxylesterase
MRYHEAEPSNQLGSIKTPTLIIHGLKDLAYISKHAKILENEISNSQSLNSRGNKPSPPPNPPLFLPMTNSRQ